MPFELRAFGNGVFRIRAQRDGAFSDTLLSRYGLIHEPEAKEIADTAVTDGKLRLAADGDTLTLTGGRRTVTLTASPADTGRRGYTLDVPLAPSERFYGLGDETRDCIQKRGHTADMWIRNVVSYGPIPFLVSSDGWAIFVNTTYRHRFDIGDTDPDRLRITVSDGPLDVYLFDCGSMKACIAAYTKLTGRPQVLPKFAYGFLYVCNMDTDIRSLLWDCRTFRKESIPCDTVGLEPSWMSKNYDYTVDKAWNPEKFLLPYWKPANISDSSTFFYPLREMGFHFSLWLCMDYDLLLKEERDVGHRVTMSTDPADFTDAEIIDEHLDDDVYMDKITKHDEDWFEHLKKFVDNGAAAFKLDGSNQVSAHPDRLWAGKYLDAEVHNLYPVLYARQMAEGFETYTGRRSMIYTAAMYAGTPGYAATWAGDTGGGPKSMTSLLNFSMTGHSNSTCDMMVTSVDGIHCGFLMPWAQYNDWAYWRYPWFLRPSLEEAIRFYSNLRSSLFPTLYAAAYEAWETGLPMARPLSLIYEDTDRYDNAMTLYFLGDSLLVGAFEMHFPLPDGLWIDFWTGDEYAGGGVIDYTPPEGRGGALFVKAGAIIGRMDPQPAIMDHIPASIYLDWYPREGMSGEFTLYEDDGETLAYRDGTTARTRITGVTKDGVATLTVSPRDPGGVADEYLSKKLVLRIHTPENLTAIDAATGSPLPASRSDGVVTVDLPFGFAGGCVRVQSK
ncbi:MAG: DUF5110 domain-containing protein [Clostridia bacterium]|nr:DUF5110 domain-containing protein [Clostridia bacterium]